MSVPIAVPAWQGEFNPSKLLAPGDVGVCRHWYLADEANLVRDGGGKATTIANLGSEGDAVGLAVSSIIDGRQGLSFQNDTPMTSLLGFAGTDLTIFVACLDQLYQGAISVADRSGGVFGGSCAAIFGTGTNTVRVIGTSNSNYGYYLTLDLTDFGPKYRVIGMRISFVNATPVLNPLFGPQGLKDYLPTTQQAPTPAPFNATDTVTLGQGPFLGNTLNGYLRGASVHEGLLPDEEFFGIGNYWYAQVRSALETPAPLAFSQVADYLEAPEPVEPTQFGLTLESPILGYTVTGRTLQVDGQDYAYISNQGSPFPQFGSGTPNNAVDRLAIGGLILPLDHAQGIWTCSAVTVRLTVDRRIRVETEHNAAQSAPLAPNVPHSFLVLVDFTGADADAHLPTLIVDGVEDKTLDGAGFGARTVAYTAVKFSPVTDEVPPPPSTTVESLILNSIFTIYDLPVGSQVDALVAWLESRRTTGGVLSRTWPLEGLRHSWQFHRVFTNNDLSPFNNVNHIANIFNDGHNQTDGDSGFLADRAYNVQYNWNARYIRVANSQIQDHELLHNGGPVTLYVLGYFPQMDGTEVGGFGVSPLGPILSTSRTLAPGTRGFFLGHSQGRIHFMVRSAAAIVLDLAFDLVGQYGLIITMNYGGGSPECVIESVDLAGTRAVVASGDFTGPPEAGAAADDLGFFDQNNNDKYQFEAGALAYWAGLVDKDLIAAQQAVDLVGTDDLATLAARPPNGWPRLFIATAFFMDLMYTADGGSGGFNGAIYYWDGVNLNTSPFQGLLQQIFGQSNSGRACLIDQVPPLLQSRVQINPNIRLSPRTTLAWTGRTPTPPSISSTFSLPWDGTNALDGIFYSFLITINPGTGVLSFYIHNNSLGNPGLTVEFDDGSGDGTIIKTYLIELDFNELDEKIIRAVYIDGVLIPGVVTGGAGRGVWVNAYGSPAFEDFPGGYAAWRCLFVYETIFPPVMRAAIQAELDYWKAIQPETFPEDYGFAEDSFHLANERPQFELSGYPSNITLWNNRVHFREADRAANRGRCYYNLDMDVGGVASAGGDPTLVTFAAPAPADQLVNPDAIRAGTPDAFTFSFVAKSPAAGEQRVVELVAGDIFPGTIHVYIDSTGLRVLITDGSAQVSEVRVNGITADALHSYLVELDFTLTGAATVKAILVDGAEPTPVVLQNASTSIVISSYTFTYGDTGLQLRGLATHRTHFDTTHRALLVAWWEGQKA